MTIPCIAIVNKILCHRYRYCEFSRVIKQYAIRKNDLSKKEKMLHTNRQTLRKNTLKKWHFFPISRLESRACEAMYRSRGKPVYLSHLYRMGRDTIYRYRSNSYKFKLNSNFKEFEIILWKKDAFECARIRGQVFQLFWNFTLIFNYQTVMHSLIFGTLQIIKIVLNNLQLVLISSMSQLC